MSAQKFGRYPKYRASNCVWLGEIPAHWDLKPVKHFCSFAGGSTPSKENRRYWDGGTVPWVSPKDMKVFALSETQDQITERAVKESSVSIIAPGALLMVVRSGILQRTIPVAINSVSVTLNQDMKALIFAGSKGAEYFAYLVQGHVSALLQRWTKEGATVESVEHEFLANDSVPDVPTDERRAIVEFLDYETAKIDALIEKQQQLIALLKEKRQAVISHAVTKGLNPDAPLRDSGVEWLGDVPSHWPIAAIRWITMEHKQGFYTKDSYVEQGTPLLRITDIAEDSSIDFSNCPELEVTKGDLKEFGLNIGDFVFVRSGASVGKFGIVDEKVEAIFGSYTIRFRFHKQGQREFLKWFFQSAAFLNGLFSTLHGGAIKNINAENIKGQMIAMPPVAEQLAIAKRLDEVGNKMTLLVAVAEQTTERLLERRTALISAAVTGKIDVRGWLPPESKLQPEAA